MEDLKLRKPDAYRAEKLRQLISSKIRARIEETTKTKEREALAIKEIERFRQNFGSPAQTTILKEVAWKKSHALVIAKQNEEEWKRSITADLHSYSKIVCTANATRIYDRICTLPRELQDMIFSSLLDDSFDDDSAKILVKEKKIRFPHSYSLVQGGITGLSNLRDCSRKIEHRQLRFYEDPEYVGPGLAQEMNWLYYRNGRFDLHDIHLLHKFLTEDRLGQGLIPAQIVRYLAFPLHLDSDTISENGGYKQCSNDMLRELTTLKRGCRVDMTITLAGLPGTAMSRLLGFLRVIQPIVLHLVAKGLEIRLRVIRFFDGRDPDVPWLQLENTCQSPTEILNCLLKKNANLGWIA